MFRHHPPRLVYIAAPYAASEGHPETHNVREALDAGVEIENTCSGVFAFVPHVSMLADIVHCRPASYWYAADLEVLERCDALIVAVDRPSKGVEMERRFAADIGIPVFEGVGAFTSWWLAECR